MRAYDIRHINTNISPNTLKKIANNEPFALVGSITSLHALTLSPNALGPYTIPPTATRLRYISSPSEDGRLKVRESVRTEDEQLIFTFHHSRSTIWELLRGLSPISTIERSPIGTLFENKAPEELLHVWDSITRLDRTSCVMLLHVDHVYIRTNGRKRADESDEELPTWW